MKDPDIVSTPIFPNTEFPIMESINRHELSWVGTKFCIVCILYYMSQCMKTVVKR